MTDDTFPYYDSKIDAYAPTLVTQEGIVSKPSTDLMFTFKDIKNKIPGSADKDDLTCINKPES